MLKNNFLMFSVKLMLSVLSLGFMAKTEDLMFKVDQQR